MFKVYDKNQNVTFVGETTPRYDGKELTVMVSSNTDLSLLHTAARIDICDPNMEDYVTASYRVVGWKALEHLWDGIRITWQTFSPDEIDTMQGKLEEMDEALAKANEIIAQYESKVETLTKAVLDLASVVGTPNEQTSEPKTVEEPVETAPAETEEKPKRGRKKKEESQDG